MGCYAVYQNEYNNFWYYGDLRGDDTKSGLVSNLTASDVDKFILNNDAGILRTTWSNYYSVITRANNVLTKIDKADAAVVKNKDQYIGEAKFLRALAYFNLVRIFGDVPMITTNVSIDEAYKVGRDKADKVYDEVIIKDLLDAEVKLPLKYAVPILERLPGEQQKPC